MDNEELNNLLKKIEKKLENNPELREEIAFHIERMEEIFETNVEVYVVHSFGEDQYRDVFENYSDDDLNYESMTLGVFIDILKQEDKNLKVSIDPIYLKKGINSIEGVLLTTLNDKLIIVPTSKKDEKENNRN